jgi:hypothetical protein
MTSDMMIICIEDRSSYDEGGIGAFLICECSMGDPLDEFGEWFQDRFCGSPSMIEQMAGVEDHYYTKVIEADVDAVKSAFKSMTCDADKMIIDYMKEHVGKHISTENW